MPFGHAVHGRVVGRTIELRERSARSLGHRIRLDVDLGIHDFREQPRNRTRMAPHAEQTEVRPRRVALLRHQQRLVADRVLGPTRLEPDVEQQLAAVRQQDVPRVHFFFRSDRRVAGELDPIADLDRAFVDTHTLQHGKRARLDGPIRHDAVRVASTQRKRRVRITPQQVGDLAFDLGDRLRVEAAEEAMVSERRRGGGERREHGTGAERAAVPSREHTRPRSRRGPLHFAGLRKMKNA